MHIWLNSVFFYLKLTDVRSDRVTKDQKLKLRVIHFLSLGHEIVTTFWKFCWICCKINKQIPQQAIWKLLVKRGVDYKWGNVGSSTRHQWPSMIVVVKQAQPLKTLKRGADPLFPAAALRTVVSSRYGSDTFLYAYVTAWQTPTFESSWKYVHLQKHFSHFCP